MNNRARTLQAVLRKDFRGFVRKCFITLNPGERFQNNWHLDAIIFALEEAGAGRTTRLIINVPPRSLKSLICSIAWPAFLLGLDPSRRIICVSHAQDLASKFSRDFRRIVEADWYRSAFPKLILGKCTESEIETTVGGGRLATSIGAVVTGFGGSIIIIDDPLKPDDAASVAACDKVIAYYRKTLLTRLDDKQTGLIMLVMQRLHENDLSGYLLGRPDGNWRHLSLPATAPADVLIPAGPNFVHLRKKGDLLHPSREPQAVLDEMRREMGSAAYEAQYQQSPVPDGGNMIKRDWFTHYQPPLDPRNGLIYQAWDTALKGDPQHDYSVCTTWMYRENKYFLIDVFRRQLEFHQLLQKAKSLHDDFGPAAVLIEDQGSGTILAATLHRSYGITTLPWRSEKDKLTRVATISHMIERGDVALPEDASWLPEFLREVLGFPNTKYDDQVDSMSMFLSWMRDREPSGYFEAFWP